MDMKNGIMQYLICMTIVPNMNKGHTINAYVFGKFIDSIHFVNCQILKALIDMTKEG